MCARDLLMGVLLTTEEESVEFPKKDRHLANSQHWHGTCFVWGHAQMTSAERGREGGTQILTVGGGGCVISIVKILTRGGRGSKIPKI